MQKKRHQLRLRIVLTIPLFLGLAGEGKAAEGDIEINQIAALTGGVTAGDLPGFPVDINEGGNFFLTSNLDLSSEANPQNVTAIRVNAPGVAIDMGGKGIVGTTVCTAPPVVSCSPTGTGIGIQFLSGIGTIKNGVVSGMGGDGIDMSAATFGIVSNVGAFNNGTNGIELPLGSSARRVTASANGAVGIKLGAGGAVLEATAFNNGSHGIKVGDGSQVKNVTASGNGGSGISMGAAALLDTCIANGNGGSGVKSAAGGIVSDCVTVVNTVDGIQVGVNTTVTHNSSYSNGDDGIQTGANCTVIGNSASQNPGYGLNLGTESGYMGNVANFNVTGAVNGVSIFELGGVDGNVCAGGLGCP